MLTDIQIDEIKKRHAAATPGVWRLLTMPQNQLLVAVDDDDGNLKSIIITEPNFNFIANAHQDVPALLATISELKAKLVGMKIVE